MPAGVICFFWLWLLAGCAFGTGGSSWQESYQTTIVADGTKLLDYSIEFPQKAVRPVESRLDIGRDQYDQEEIEQLLVNRMESILADIDYCHDKYMEIERRISHVRSTIRIECRDTATVTDRHRFLNKNTATNPVRTGEANQ